ncbi:MAG: SusC/RagA family TonB-linked outer membrane protein [Haliscomenobacter sp.]|nr:SusC/RagA family TonB-linked outer membrane protein [Haliscomenobacter sp.]MBK9490920.1 SusC/RagA family TonB-linked outer membrane protein [Haliscomenobacter sp.]
MKLSLPMQGLFLALRSFCLLFGLLLSLQANAQRTLNGTISDAKTGEALIGASVTVKNTVRGTVTDVDGKFSVVIGEGENTLIVSYTGYPTTEVDVTNQTNLSLTLEADVIGLSEVMVTGLGVTKERRFLTSSQQAVKSSELIKAREPNNIAGLVGKIAGLTIGLNSEMLRRPNVVLRGSGDILYVVDGVPINSDTWNINTDDVEHYTVLKGATASAIYGFRGRNGAILITSKKGSKNPRGFSVEFNSSSMMENGFNSLPTTQDEYGPGDHGIYEFVDGKGGGKNDNDYDVWGPPLDGRLLPQYDSPVDPATGKLIPTPWIPRGKDNLERFLRPGFLFNNSVAVSSSTDRSDLRFSLGHMNQTGIVPNTNLNITNFNANIGYNFTDRLRFEANINYNRQYTDNIPDANYGPNSLIYNITTWAGADWDVDDMKQIWQPGKEGVQQIYAEYQRYNNPWFMANYWLRGHYNNNTYGYLSLSYKITPDLKLIARNGVNTYDLLRTEKMPYSAGAYGRDERRGDYREDRRSLFENNTDVMLDFSRTFNKIRVNVLGGGAVRTFKYTTNYASTDYLITPGVYNFANSANPVRAFGYNANMLVTSGYYSADVTLNKYLTLSHTGRVDRISTLPTENQTFFYPSLGFNSIVTEYVKLGPISLLKLRGAYANVKDGLTQSTIGAAGASVLGYGENYSSVYNGPSYANAEPYSTPLGYNNAPAAYYTNTLSNAALDRNSREEFELGADIGLFKNMVNVEFTYFNVKEGPLIFARPISETSGYTAQQVNGIVTRRKGVEITLSADPFKNKTGLRWNPMINFSTLRERWVKFYTDENGNELTQLDPWRQIGDRVDEINNVGYLYTQDGQIINDAGGRPIRLASVNGNARKLLGHMDPDFVWSFINRFSVKNWTLQFQFDGRVGGVIANYIQRQTFRGGRHIETTEGAMGIARLEDTKGNRTWVGEGVQLVSGTIKTDDYGNITNYNELVFKPNDTKTFLQDWISRYYQDDETNLMSRTFAKLREITLTYKVPLKSNSFFNQMTVSLVARNLLYFAEKKDVDLDRYIGRQGSSDFDTPTTKRYGVNFNFTF